MRGNWTLGNWQDAGGQGDSQAGASSTPTTGKRPTSGRWMVHLPSQRLTGMLLKYLRFARCQVWTEVWPPKGPTVWPQSHFKLLPHLLRMFSSVQFSCSVVSDSLRPHGLQHARLPCPSPTPGACSNSCPSSWMLVEPITPLCIPLYYFRSL